MANSATTSSLKPCPFCGETVNVDSYNCDAEHAIGCRGCGVVTDVYLSRKMAVTAWNRRAGPSNNAQPVAWMLVTDDDIEYNGHNEFPCGKSGVPLCAVPPAAEPDITALRNLVDIVWNDATESTEVPSTARADELISRVFNASAAAPVDIAKLIEGMSVSVDVSTCDADAGHRYFGTVSAVQEHDGVKNGVMLLVEDAEPNFVAAAPVVPDEMPREFKNGWPLYHSDYAEGWNACRAAMLKGAAQ